MFRSVVCSALALALAGPASAQDLLWYSGNSGQVDLGQRYPQVVDDAAASLGVGFTLSATWPANLGTYQVVFLGVSASSYDPQQVADLQAFLAGGGVLVLVGEAYSFDSSHVGVYDSLLGSLGYGSRFGTATLDAMCTHYATPVGTSPLVSGVADVGYAYTNEVVVGPVGEQILRSAGGSVFAVAEGSVVLIGDSAPFLDSCTLGPGNQVFVENLWSGGVPVDCDVDGDGYDSLACGGTDCDDDDPAVSPGEAETTCDGVDNDCDPSTVDEPDDDGDGVTACTDCDDSDADVFPDAAEDCNGIDDDCNGTIDEGFSTNTYWEDGDGDGYGASGGAVTACVPPPDHVENGDDCDDANPGVNPAAAEVPGNGIDENCDGVDAASTTAPTSQSLGCGCDGTGSGGAGWLVVGLIGLARRRR